MKKHTTTTTIFAPYGLIRISGQVERDTQFDPITEGIAGSPFDIRNLKVHASPLHNPQDITDELKADELELIESVLIDKYLEEVEAAEQDYKDRLIDEAIQAGREYAANAYA